MTATTLDLPLLSIAAADRERLTPEQRDEVQAYYLRRHLAAERVAQPERRGQMRVRTNAKSLHAPAKAAGRMLST